MGHLTVLNEKTDKTNMKQIIVNQEGKYFLKVYKLAKQQGWVGGKKTESKCSIFGHIKSLIFAHFPIIIVSTSSTITMLQNAEELNYYVLQLFIE